MSDQIILRTAADEMVFDAATGRLVTLRPHVAPDRQLLASADDHPVFAVQYLDAGRAWQELTSFDAAQVSVDVAETDGGQELRLSYRRLGGLDLDLTATVRVSVHEDESRWGVSLRNGAGLEVVAVQYPFVVAACGPAPAPADAATLSGAPAPCPGKLLLPLNMGALIHGPSAANLGVDSPAAWRTGMETPETLHYPGSFFAQFLAYYREDIGLYLACDDTAGNVKLIRALWREPGLRLGVAHVGDWPTEAGGERTLEYDVLLRSFAGDWYDAAEIYREWTLQQAWATPLHERKDVPDWILDSPPHITLRLQGYVDDGPVFPVEEFLPYEKTIPLLEGVAEAVEAPLAAILMSWEHGGPWVYPECFPPVGGDESLTHFCALARERGWRVGSFCNGTRWVMGHKWNGYKGDAYFEAHHGEDSVCRVPSGDPWTSGWDGSWRPSYLCCLGADLTRQIALDFVRRLIGWGMDSIQFFDQNINAATFRCFADDHDHPPVPGKWMADRMASIIADFGAEAQAAGEEDVLQSVEQPCNEYCLPLFQQCDVRGQPPDHGVESFVPVYAYLFHECILTHGMMNVGYEPYALPMRNAYNCVTGEIPGAVLTGDGTLLNRETFNWAEWEPKVGSNRDAVEMIRTVTALRRGPGRPYLVFGRMQRPAEVRGVPEVKWQHGGASHEVPAVFHAAWQSPEGHFAVVLANWTSEAREVEVVDVRLSDEVRVHTSGHTLATVPGPAPHSRVTIAVPPLGCVLVERR